MPKTAKKWLEETRAEEVANLKRRVAELEAENARLRLIVNTSPPRMPAPKPYSLHSRYVGFDYLM